MIVKLHDDEHEDCSLGRGGGMIGNKLVASFVYTFSKLKLSADMYDSFLKNLIEP